MDDDDLDARTKAVWEVLKKICRSGRKKSGKKKKSIPMSFALSGIALELATIWQGSKAIEGEQKTIVKVTNIKTQAR